MLLDMLAGYRVQDRVRLRGRNHKVFIRGIFLFKRRRYDGSISRAAGQQDVVRQVIRGTAARQGTILIAIDIRAGNRDALDAVGRRTKRTRSISGGCDSQQSENHDQHKDKRKSFLCFHVCSSPLQIFVSCFI